MRLIVITPPETLPDEMESLLGLFKAGLEILHLRKPGFSEMELAEYLRQIPLEYRQRIMIHSHPSLATQFSLRGIHVTERAKEDLLQQQKGFPYHRSVACHRLEELPRLRKFEYVLLSPIFDSLSKKNYRAAFEDSLLVKALQEKKNPVIALGGCCYDNLALIQEYGFDGAAFLGAIWNAPDRVQQFQRIRDRRSLHRPLSLGDSNG